MVRIGGVEHQRVRQDHVALLGDHFDHSGPVVHSDRVLDMARNVPERDGYDALEPVAAFTFAKSRRVHC